MTAICEDGDLHMFKDYDLRVRIFKDFIHKLIWYQF